MESDQKFDKLELCTGKYRIELVTRTKTRAGIGLIDLISQPVLWNKLLLLVTKNGMSTPIFPWIYRYMKPMSILTHPIAPHQSKVLKKAHSDTKNHYFYKIRRFFIQ